MLQYPSFIACSLFNHLGRQLLPPYSWYTKRHPQGQTLAILSVVSTLTIQIGPSIGAPGSSSRDCWPCSVTSHRTVPDRLRKNTEFVTAPRPVNRTPCNSEPLVIPVAANTQSPRTRSSVSIIGVPGCDRPSFVAL